MKILKPLLKPYQKRLQNQKKSLIKSVSNQEEYPTDEVCTCLGSNGTIKDFYADKESALWVAKRYKREFRIVLNIYDCPSSKGWHLTKIVS